MSYFVPILASEPTRTCNRVPVQCSLGLELVLQRGLSPKDTCCQLLCAPPAYRCSGQRPLQMQYQTIHWQEIKHKLQLKQLGLPTELVEIPVQSSKYDIKNQGLQRCSAYCIDATQHQQPICLKRVQTWQACGLCDTIMSDDGKNCTEMISAGSHS